MADVPHLAHDIRCSSPNAVTIEPVRESYGLDFYVYRGDTLLRVCPSIGMAREVAAGAA